MRKTLLRFAGPCIAALAVALPADGQTVINVPPDEAPTAIGSDTQLNLFEAGSIPNKFNAGSPNGFSTNVEVNVSGGTVGTDFLAMAAEVTISGGTIGNNFSTRQGSTLNISGGTFVYNIFAVDSMVNITGGAFPGHFTARDSTVNISGGVFELSVDMVRSTLNISGGLVGTNEDGSTNLVWDNSTVNITDGTVGPFFAREGTTVTITGGTVEEFFTAVTGATVDVFGGVLKGSFRVRVGGTVNLFGGTVERMENSIGIDVTDGGTVNIAGGTVDSAIELGPGGMVNISGGALDVSFNARNGSTLNIFGTEFLLDGLPIAGLDDVGDSVILTGRDGAMLQATLRDGKSFDFPVSTDRFHADATLRLILAEPVPEPSTLGLALLATLGLSIRQPRRRRRTGQRPIHNRCDFFN